MKKKRIPSAIPIYIAAGIWLLYGMVLPLYQAAHLLMATGLSVAGYMAAGKFFPGKIKIIEQTQAQIAKEAQ